MQSWFSVNQWATGGEPGPSPSHKLLSIDSRGMSGQVVEPLDGPIIFPEPLAVPIQRKGFDETGAPAMHPTTIYSTARLREPYPDSTQNHIEPTSAGVVFSENVCEGDVIAGVENNSTLKWPRLTARWTRRDLRVVGDSLQVGMSVIGHNSRNQKLAACVVYEVSDGTTTLTHTVTQPQPFIQPGTGLSIIEWGHAFDTSGFPDGATLTVNARVYPWYGDADSVFDTRDFVQTWDTRAQTYMKHAALQPVYAYVDPVGGNNETGIASTDPEAARSAPFATISTAGIGAALEAENSAANGLSTSKWGCVVRVMGALSTGSSMGFGNARGSVIEADPVNYPGDADYFPLSLAGTFHCEGLLFRKAQVTREGTGGFVGIEGAGVVYFEDVEINAGTVASPSRLVGTSGCGAYFWKNVKLGAVSGGVNYWMPYTTTQGGGVHHWQDVTTTSYVGDILANAVLGCRIWSGQLRANAGSLGGDHDICVESFIHSGTGGSGARNYSGGSMATRPACELNYLVEGISANAQNFMGISGDVQSYSVYGYKGWYRTVAGWNLQQRENNAYDDTMPSPAREHPWFSISKSIIVRTATKGDRFSQVEDGTRQGSWWWEYQVGGRDNVIQFALNFPLVYYGLNSKYATVPNVPLAMDWSDYQAATDGTAGEGGGDYRMGPGSVAADMDNEPAVGWDVEGNPRVPGGPVGAHGALG